MFVKPSQKERAKGMRQDKSGTSAWKSRFCHQNEKGRKSQDGNKGGERQGNHWSKKIKKKCLYKIPKKKSQHRIR